VARRPVTLSDHGPRRLRPGDDRPDNRPDGLVDDRRSLSRQQLVHAGAGALGERARATRLPGGEVEALEQVRVPALPVVGEGVVGAQEVALDPDLVDQVERQRLVVDDDGRRRTPDPGQDLVADDELRQRTR
jgi:hypothetical protein